MSTNSKVDLHEEVVKRMKGLPYMKAIQHITEVHDLEVMRTPMQMVNQVYGLSKTIEDSITEFWQGITTVKHEKLIIDGDNLLMLYLYVIL